LIQRIDHFQQGTSLHFLCFTSRRVLDLKHPSRIILIISEEASASKTLLTLTAETPSTRIPRTEHRRGTKSLPPCRRPPLRNQNAIRVQSLIDHRRFRASTPISSSHNTTAIGRHRPHEVRIAITLNVQVEARRDRTVTQALGPISFACVGLRLRDGQHGGVSWGRCLRRGRGRYGLRNKSRSGVVLDGISGCCRGDGRCTRRPTSSRIRDTVDTGGRCQGSIRWLWLWRGGAERYR